MQEVRKRLSSEAAATANRSGRWKNQTRRAAHNGCCRRVAQTRALCSVLWKLLVSEELVEVLLRIEIPLVKILSFLSYNIKASNTYSGVYSLKLLNKNQVNV